MEKEVGSVSSSGCSGLNVCVPPNSHVQILMPNVVKEDGAFGK